MQKIEKLKKIESEYKNKLQQIENPKELQKLKKEYLGSEGSLNLILSSLSDLDLEKRKKVGKKANKLKREILSAIENKREELKKEKLEQKEKQESIDVTLPGREINRGQIHPISRFLRKMKKAFQGLGFEIYESPEVDTEFYNFEALNIPASHPARTMWDTFWLEEDYRHSDPHHSEKGTERTLLRTHTSSGQVRFMEKNSPPFRVVLPGRCFRYEKPDATHGFQFYHLEGLMVGKDITITNFKAVMEELFERLYGVSKTRMRPGYFPFVEPGFELDLRCPNGCSTERENQAGDDVCDLCEGTGWVEIMGAGMVHPEVFESAGYNPENWQGFAFGIGIDRLAMAGYNIPDLRLLYEGKALDLEAKS